MGEKIPAVWGEREFIKPETSWEAESWTTCHNARSMERGLHTNRLKQHNGKRSGSAPQRHRNQVHFTTWGEKEKKETHWK